jgi:hypothetical protein
LRKTDTWAVLNKSSSIVSLVTGLLFLAQAAWGVSSRFKEGVPFWLLLTSSLSCIVFGLFLSIWIQSKRGSADGANLRKLGRINFDYLPSIPTDHGWSLGFDGTTPEESDEPEFLAAQDSPVTGSLAIKEKGRYYIDFKVDQVQSLANVVEYYIQPSKSGTFYLNVNICPHDRSQTRNVWLCHVIGTGAPRQLNRSEWRVEVEGEVLEDGWILIKLSINDEIAATFGNEGFVYQSLRCLRIRGSLAISPITFYRIESQQKD